MAVRRRRLILGGAAAAASALAAAGCQRAAPPAAPSFNGIDITGASYAQDFALPDADGRVRRLADFRGRVVMVFFGYTQCPDVCPATMLELAAAKKVLGADGDRVQGVFITVDPERDTAAVLKPYVENFGSGTVALRGSVEETKALARDFKVFFAKVPGRTEGSYTIDHTAGAYLFDAGGRVRVVTRQGGGADKLAADLRALLAQG